MLSSVFLASAFAASGALAATSQGSWAVRADFSRCNTSTPLEPVLDGAKSVYSTTDKIVDFNIDSPFQGNLVIKVAGAAGFGSPYPPQQVAVKVFAEANGGDPGVWANATVIPGMGQPALISGIYWNTRSDITVSPAANETVSVETIFDGGSLVVFYELVMSRNITLRIGDTEFIVDQTASSDAAQAGNMPWFTFITRKSIGYQSGNNLRAAVEFVDASRASDPRDKIFGVLGLIDSAEHRTAAAYSISFRHLVIGYYAYCLIAKKDIRVMFEASSSRSPEGMPSWAPPARYDVSNSVHIIPGIGYLRPDWLYGSKDFKEAYEKHHWIQEGHESGFGMVANSLGPWKETQVFQSILDAERSGSSAGFFNVYFQAVREFSPKLIQWENRRSNTASDACHEEVGIIELVQMRFEPDQYNVLERILDSIQEDIIMAVKKKFTVASIYDDQFNPPFLRFGWRDLALNQSTEIVESSGLNQEDIHGFHALDGIRQAIEELRETWMYEGPDPKERVYDDSIVRDHKDQTIWVAFDLLSLTLWAQTHPCMIELRRLSRFCKDGENEMTRILRPLTEEEKGWTYTDTCRDWPLNIIEDFKIDGEFRSITII
ncbi:hypothetical protein CcaCcLH18_08586 [Colletotrichum camelliae]|nr:hypothetical protein CcaCcLH18_08586 [Colletotrichum camelliae]